MGSTPGPSGPQAARIWMAVRNQFDRHATEDQLKQVNAITDAVIAALFAPTNPTQRDEGWGETPKR